MPRLLVPLLVVVVVIVAALVGLSTMAHEKPLKHVEKVVPVANLPK